MSKNPKLYYTAGELADLFELPKQTLLYYDKMGVLSPEFISENNYRHYSLKQYLILEVIILAQILYGTYNSTWYVLNYLRYYLAFSAF